MNNFSTHDSLDDLAFAVATEIADGLAAAIKSRGSATFVASGGGTPKPALALLSQNEDVDWRKVTVTLSDERIAPPEAEVSNADMLRTHLLQGAAATARLVELDSISALDDIDQPLDILLLGMGGDGHFASIFPDGDGMKAALAADAPTVVETTPSPLPPEAPYPRLTLSLATIRQARRIILMISGEKKRDVLELAARDTPEGDLPVRHLLHDQSLPLSVHWAA